MFNKVEVEFHFVGARTVFWFGIDGFEADEDKDKDGNGGLERCCGGVGSVRMRVGGW